MRIMSRTSAFLVAASLMLSLVVASGALATDATTVSVSADHARTDTASPTLAGFGTSPGGRTAFVMTACAKGKHLPEPIIT